ncbi:MAG: nSTAND1 domain-containing NTPase [Candidatus Binatia bacterium]
MSHSNKDEFEVIAIRVWLKENGWDDVLLNGIPTEGIQTAERWERTLCEIFTRCEAAVFLVSRNWLDCDLCRTEYELARKLNKRIFVVLIDKLSIGDLPPYVKDAHQTVSLASGEDNQVLRVTLPGMQEEREITLSCCGLVQLKTELAQARVDPSYFSWPPESEPDRAPYRGLEPLQAVDAGVFFGRNEALIEAMDALRGLAGNAGPRLFVILGASGAGKSSFLTAGLWPRLALDEGHFLPLPVIRPGKAAISGSNGLLASLVRVAEKHDLCMTSAQIREAVVEGANALRPLLRKLAERAAVASKNQLIPTVLIAIDQAEELFEVEGNSERGRILTLLRDLMSTEDPAIIILFAARTDSYDALVQAKSFGGSHRRVFTLPPLGRDAYQLMIECPAKRLHQAERTFEIDPDLTQLMLDDADKSVGDSLPLLAFALEQLYRCCGPAQRIDQAVYAGFGGLAGSIDAALGRVFVAADADRRIPKNDEARFALLRHGLIPLLAGIDPETRTTCRRMASVTQIPENARPLIDLLVEQRLITRYVDEETREATLELAHEALLRRWGRLKGWLDEEFGRLAALQVVKRAALEWDANARSKTWAAHSGALLEEALRLYARLDFMALLVSTDRAYLAACIEKERAAREAPNVQCRSEGQPPRDQSKNLLPRAQNAWRTTWIYSIGLVVVLTLGALALVAYRVDGFALDLAQKLKQFPGTSVAVDILNQARRLQDQLPSRQANSNDLWRRKSVALNQAVEARLAIGDTKGAIVAAQQSAALMELVLASNPTDAGWRRDLSVSYEKVGDAQRAQSDFAGAQQSYRADLAIAEALSASDPSNAQWRWDLSVSYEKVGDVQQAQGDLAGALKSFRAAMAIRETVSASHTSNVGWRRDLAVIYERVGDTLEKQNDVPGAVAAFERALAIYQELSRTHRDDTQSLVFSVVPHWRLAELDKPKQRENLGAALAILESLAMSNRLDEKRQGWLTQIKAQLAELDEPKRVPEAEATERMK